MRRPITAGCGLVLIAGLAACGSDDGSGGATTPVASASSAAPTAPSTSSSSSTATAPPGTATEEPGATQADATPWVPISQNTEAEGSGSSSLTGVRLGVHDGYERVVFDITGDAGATVGWFATPTDQAVADPSGEPVDLDGDTFLNLGINGVANGAEGSTDSAGRPAFTGTVDDADGSELVDEVRVFGAWEGQNQVIVGLDDDVREYRVTRLSDPARLALDVR